ncbi:MAG: hypothetical protein WC934_14800 [Acidithiobacillus sp.]|jgi:hypothetical protein|uniref:hypothetical protein n=1 Tax=Acidithiobacillus sp. TaxID=1872118 RepID=UPI00355F163D
MKIIIAHKNFEFITLHNKEVDKYSVESGVSFLNADIFNCKTEFGIRWCIQTKSSGLIFSSCDSILLKCIDELLKQIKLRNSKIQSYNSLIESLNLLCEESWKFGKHTNKKNNLCEFKISIDIDNTLISSQRHFSVTEVKATKFYVENLVFIELFYKLLDNVISRNNEIYEEFKKSYNYIFNNKKEWCCIHKKYVQDNDFCYLCMRNVLKQKSKGL